MNLNEKSILIKNRANKLGFDSCGIAKAEELTNEKAFLQTWLDKGLNASMHYLNNNFEKRVNPTVLVEGAKSVISVVLNYFPEKLQSDSKAPIISKYAYSIDYHSVLKKKLNSLFSFINENIGTIEGRVFVDSAPVLDRAWAARSGIGWIGKNTNLIVPEVGSFVFIGELIINMELAYDSAIEDRCGSCTKCIDACPTNALAKPYLLDSNKCISFLTIENKDDIPSEFRSKFENRVFGCDICQDVCPWNSKVKATKEPEFTPSKKLLELTNEEWQNIDEGAFKDIFRKSAVKRTKYKGLRRNIDFID